VSDTATSERTATGSAAAGPATGRSRSLLKPLLLAVAFVVLLLVPIYVEEFWLRTGFAVFGAAIGAIGLNLLVGTTGQLSLAHAFFLAVGAVTYTFVAGEPGGVATEVGGLGLPPLLGMVLGVLLAGLAGLLFSPVAARLRGIYLGVASLGLVFIGIHLINTWEYVTGGFNGRIAPDFSLFGFEFSNNASYLAVAGVPFREAERLWYLGLALVAIAFYYGRHLVEGRPGRALETVRDSEVAAAVMGVDVTRYKAAAFTVSSMYAGLSGVLLALIFNRIVPESFGLNLSVEFLAMIVIGGLGSVRGAVLGAVFVSMLPKVLDKYGDSLPLLAQAGSGSGIEPGQAARFAFGLAIVAVLLFAPGGIGSLWRGPRGKTAAPAGPGPARPPAAEAPAQSVSSPPKERST